MILLNKGKILPRPDDFIRKNKFKEDQNYFFVIIIINLNENKKPS